MKSEKIRYLSVQQAECDAPLLPLLCVPQSLVYRLPFYRLPYLDSEKSQCFLW